MKPKLRVVKPMFSVKDKPSLTMLRTLLEESNSELQIYRDTLFAIIKEQGRIRFAKKTVDELDSGDHIDVKDDGVNVTIEFKRGE